MTMPHLENCHHSPDSWCLDCVKKLGEENLDLRMALLRVSQITMCERVSEGESTLYIKEEPENMEIYEDAFRRVGECCKKYLI